MADKKSPRSCNEVLKFSYNINSDTFCTYEQTDSSDVPLKERYRFEKFLDCVMSGNFCTEKEAKMIKRIVSLPLYLRSAKVRVFNNSIMEWSWYSFKAEKVIEDSDGQVIVGRVSNIRTTKQGRAEYGKLRRVLKSIKDDYIGLFEVDLETNTFSTLHYSAQKMLPLPAVGKFSDLARHIAYNFAESTYREKLLPLTDFDYIRSLFKSRHKIELEYKSCFGGHPWRRITCQVAEYKDGVPATLILYHSDIDNIKKEQIVQQQAIEDAYRLAEAASAAKTEFLSHMSHDMRTPMNAIIGMTAIASVNIENPHRVQECLAKISSASRHLLALINEVLDMCKIESGTMEIHEESFDLSDVMDKMVSLILPQINDKKQKLLVDAGHLIHEKVMGDSLRLQKVFVNLISNSVKYTPDGGTISITVKEKASSSPNYANYEFCFEDSGIGMSKEFQKVLFDPFTRSDDKRVAGTTGTGLGMTIARNLIRLMGGDISVSSELDKGTKITVALPLKTEEHCSELPEDLLNLPVLVVDDDQIACTISCLLLESIGMKSDWCLSGREAIEKVVERHKSGNDFYAVILDWEMPEMDGVETARRIREKVGPNITIIFLTAYDWGEIEAEARAAGVNHFMSKPLFRSKLIASFCSLSGCDNMVDIPKPIFDGKKVFDNKRVLLAEDNDLNAEITIELLGMTGISVERACNGAEALSMVENTNPGYYDLILMDLQMPVMDGFKATVAIRSLGREDAKSIPIVAMTANAMVEDVHHALSSGMNAHIAKPIDFKTLEDILMKYMSAK